VNDQGQYINQQSNYVNNHPVYARENSQTQLIHNNQYATTKQYQQYHQDSSHYRDPFGYQQKVGQHQNSTFHDSSHDCRINKQMPPQPTQRTSYIDTVSSNATQPQPAQQLQPEMTTWSQSKIDTRT